VNSHRKIRSRQLPAWFADSEVLTASIEPRINSLEPRLSSDILTYIIRSIDHVSLANVCQDFTRRLVNKCTPWTLQSPRYHFAKSGVCINGHDLKSLLSPSSVGVGEICGRICEPHCWEATHDSGHHTFNTAMQELCRRTKSGRDLPFLTIYIQLHTNT
jgi:hypothetical protein